MTKELSVVAHGRPPLDVTAIRQEFPILRQPIHGRRLAYLDNASTTQKPRAVIERLASFYAEENANVHRGVHWLSERSTAAYEQARATVARFLNAATAEEIVFVRGTTEAINLVAATWGRSKVARDDEIVISAMAHHSNIVPWQILCEATGARLRVLPVTDAGELDLDAYRTLLTDRTRIIAVEHVSNVLGTVNPIEAMVRLAHERGIPVLVDGAQAVAHTAIDVQALGCDFYAFSGHKVYGPTGIGVLYGRSALLASMPPYQAGGDMIRTVTFERTVYDDPPARFEAGTPHIAGAIGLAAAIDYLTGIGVDPIASYEHELLTYATAALSRAVGVRIIGTAADKAAVLSFVLDGVHPHDVATILDREGVAVRSGHHCCQPLMDRFGVPATTRASLALYNTHDDIDALAAALQTVRGLLG
jgi:cysteine desulfurase / selenocysteine lyase